MYYLVCESLRMGGVQSLYLRLAQCMPEKVCLISLTELKDQEFLSELTKNGIDFIDASYFSCLGTSTKRATMVNFIPLSSYKVSSYFDQSECFFHVSRLSGAVVEHRLAKYFPSEAKIKLNVGVYNDLVFGWKSSRNTYFSRLCKLILTGLFGKGGLLFYNEKSKSNMEALVGSSLEGDIIPIGIQPASRHVQLKRDKDFFKIVTIGRLVKYKTYNLHLVELLNELVNSYPEIMLDIYGYGQQEEDLRALVENNGLNKHVSFKGIIEYSKIYDALENADCFVGCGTTLLEASSFGIPSIIGIENQADPLTYGFLTDTTGLAYHEQGLDYPLKPLKDCILELISSDESYLYKLSQAHMLRARDFSIDMSALVLKSNFSNVKDYRLNPANINVLRLQLSIIYEQVTAKLGFNEAYLNKKKLENQ